MKFMTREEALAHAEGCPCKECGNECAQIIQQLKEADAEYPGNPLLMNAARILAETSNRLKHLVVSTAGLPLYDKIAELERKLAAQRTALLALSERIRREGMQGVANEIEEIVK